MADRAGASNGLATLCVGGGMGVASTSSGCEDATTDAGETRAVPIPETLEVSFI